MIPPDKSLLIFTLLLTFFKVIFVHAQSESISYIEVTNPLPDSTHYACETIPISWKVAIPSGVISQIRFIRQANITSHDFTVIASNIPSPNATGVFNWTIPDSVDSGISYLVLMYEGHMASVNFTLHNDGETCDTTPTSSIISHSSDISPTDKDDSPSNTAISSIIPVPSSNLSNSSHISSGAIAGGTIGGFAAVVGVVALFTMHRASRRREKNIDIESRRKCSSMLSKDQSFHPSRRSSTLALLDPERRTSSLLTTDQQSLASSTDLFLRRDSQTHLLYDQSRRGSAIDQRSLDGCRLGTIDETGGPEFPSSFNGSPLAVGHIGSRPLPPTPGPRPRSSLYPLDTVDELHNELPQEHADLSDFRASEPQGEPFFHIDNDASPINPHPLPPIPIGHSVHPHQLWNTDSPSAENVITEDTIAENNMRMDDISVNNTNIVDPFENDSRMEDGRVEDMNTEDPDIKNEENNDMNNDGTNIMDSPKDDSHAEDVVRVDDENINVKSEEGNDMNTDGINILDSHETSSHAEDIHTYEEDTDINNDSTNILDPHEVNSHVGDTHAENMKTDDANTKVSHTIEPSTADASSTVAHAGNDEKVLIDEQ